METLTTSKTIPGSPEEGHILQTFIKSYKSPKGLTYPEVSKKKIVKQIELLLRDPLYINLSDILKVLAEVHEVAPVTIGKWYYQFSDEYVSIPRAYKSKMAKQSKSKVTNQKHQELLDLVGALSKTNSNVTINLTINL